VDVTAPGQAFVVHGGEQAVVYGMDPVHFEITAAAARDAFDDFCRDRDRREERAESINNVSPTVIGWEDLDEYGYWRVHGTYGQVWAPRRVVPGWVPYRFGHWVWIEPWGWTWIDDAPWGFAPFHYGRWVFLDGSWCWIPGPIRVRAVYAPALVVFIGGGPGLHHYYRVGIGLGVAWFPLGPREVYIPPYRVSRVYVTKVNVANTVLHSTARIHETNVSKQQYVNKTVQGAVTAVLEETFASGRTVSRSAVAVSPRQAAAGYVGGMAPPVVPTRRSLAGGPETAERQPRPPDTALRRPVVVQRTPAAAPAPFENRRPALKSNPGRPPDSRTVDDLRRAQPAQPPEYRQVRPPAGPAEQGRQTRAEPVDPRAPKGEAQQDRLAADRAGREKETRRRAIERERNSSNRGGDKKD
jgi:Family of unknown function (DUF6600)